MATSTPNLDSPWLIVRFGFLGLFAELIGLCAWIEIIGIVLLPSSKFESSFLPLVKTFSH